MIKHSALLITINVFLATSSLLASECNEILNLMMSADSRDQAAKVEFVRSKSYFEDRYVMSGKKSDETNISSGDIFEITYLNGDTEFIVARVDVNRGAPGHGEPGFLTESVYFAERTARGQKVEVLLDSEYMKMISSIKYFGPLEKDSIPKEYLSEYKKLLKSFFLSEI